MIAADGAGPPRKRFGQHFLHDARVISRIVAAIHPGPGEQLVEIGPGRGALTLPLLDAAGTLDVVEIDRDLAARLHLIESERPGLRVHIGDALRYDFAELAKPGKRLRLVGNLPYNISTPLLFHLLDSVNVIQDMVFMLQKEVAERIAAEPGGRAYGRLSVMVQYHCQVHCLFDVGRGAFSPPPKVDSTILRLQPIARPAEAAAIDPGLMKQVVTKAFGQRRKTLRNALRDEMAAADFVLANVDPARRAETLGVDDFIRLANTVAMRRATGS